VDGLATTVVTCLLQVKRRTRKETDVPPLLDLLAIIHVSLHCFTIIALSVCSHCLTNLELIKLWIILS